MTGEARGLVVFVNVYGAHCTFIAGVWSSMRLELFVYADRI